MKDNLPNPLTNYQKLQENIGKTKNYVNSYLEGEQAIVGDDLDKRLNDRKITLEEEIKTASSKGEYIIALDLLAERRDLNQGILWTRGEHDPAVDEGGRKLPQTLIRDARKATDIQTDSPETAAANVLANILAAKEIIQKEMKQAEQKQGSEQTLEKATKIQQELDRCAQNIIDATLDDKKIPIHKVNSLIINSLKELNIEKSDKKLFNTKEFLHMKCQQYHVASIYDQKSLSGETVTIAETDNLMLGLTAKQKAMYTLIDNEAKDGKKLDLKGLQKNQPDKLQYTDEQGQTQKLSSKDLSWFNKLSGFDRGLVSDYADQIAQGQTSLPTQLRKIIPGLRNAYEKNIYAQAKGEDGKAQGDLEQIGSSKHIGCLSVHIGKVTFLQRLGQILTLGLYTPEGTRINNDLTYENALQLKDFSPPGSKQILQVLNSSSGLHNDIDRTTHGLGEKAMQKAGGDTAKTPMNIFRLIEPRKTGPYDEMLATIGSALKEEEKKGQDSSLKTLAPNVDFSKIGKCLENKPFGVSKLFGYNWYASDANRELAKLQENLKNEQDPAKKEQLTVLAATLKDCLYAKKEINNTRVISNPDTTNFCGVIKQVAYEVKGGCLANIGNEATNKKLQSLEIITQCASGKDRTGGTEIRNTQEATKNHLGLNGQENNPQAQQIIEENLKKQLNSGQQTSLAQLNSGSISCPGIKSDTKWAISASDLGTQVEKIVLKSAKENKIKADKSISQSFISASPDLLNNIFQGEYKLLQVGEKQSQDQQLSTSLVNSLDLSKLKEISIAPIEESKGLHKVNHVAEYQNEPSSSLRR